MNQVRSGYAYLYEYQTYASTTFSTSDAGLDGSYTVVHTMVDATNSGNTRSNTYEVRAIDDNCTPDLQTTGAMDGLYSDGTYVYDVESGLFEIDLPAHTHGNCHSCLDLMIGGDSITTGNYPYFLTKVAGTRSEALIDPYTTRWTASGAEKLQVSTSNYAYVGDYTVRVRFRECGGAYDDSLE